MRRAYCSQSSKAGRICAYALLVLVAHGSICSAQQTNAIPAATVTQPLYACRVNVADLPEFDGYATPGMLAANIGLSSSIQGMLDQWGTADNSPGTTSTDADYNYDDQYAESDNASSDSSTDSSYSSTDSDTSTRAQTAGRVRHKTVPASSTGPKRPSSNGSSSNYAAVRASPAGRPLVSQPAPLAPPIPPPTYIIPKPAAKRGTAAAGSRVMAMAIDGASTAPGADVLPHQRSTTAARLPYDVTAVGPQFDTQEAQLDEPEGQPRYMTPTATAHAAPAAAAAPALRTGSQSRQEGAEDDQQVSAALDAATAEAAAQAAAALPPQTSPIRHLLQDASKQTCSKGAPAQPTTMLAGKATITPPTGTLGIPIAQANVIPPDATLAVGPNYAVHVVNSLVRIFPVSSSGGTVLNPKPGQTRNIPLPDFFSLVASPCDGGYYSPAATYDKEVGRFLLTAVCGGDSNQILLTVSQDSSPLGNWALYSFAGEVTQTTRLICNGSYPVSAHTQVTYNQDGVYITFVQNCPSSQDFGTGAILFALPKWALYKGATYFWVPVWTAWEVYTAVDGVNNAAYYPGAFLQLQPVIPQRPDDVQSGVVYFVSDNLNYVNPLQRNEFTIAALINTGSLWLYEGMAVDSPTPLLVARVVSRGVTCLAVPSTRLIQPYDGDAAAGIGPGHCQRLNAGAMRPPGFWDGGAALYANKIYIADRGPDLQDSLQNFQPTIYWAVLTPSFCVSGPCAPFFGTDWGWSDGWDWKTGTWAANSDRGRKGYTDPSFYNQIFLFPGVGVNLGAGGVNVNVGPAGVNVNVGRKLQGAEGRAGGLVQLQQQQQEQQGAGTGQQPQQELTHQVSSSGRFQRLLVSISRMLRGHEHDTVINNQHDSNSGSSNSSNSGSSGVGDHKQLTRVYRDPGGAPITGGGSSRSTHSTVSKSGASIAAALYAEMSPVVSRKQMLAVLQAQLAHMKAMRPSTKSSTAKRKSYKQVHYEGLDAGPRIVFMQHQGSSAGSTSGNSSGGSGSESSTSNDSSSDGNHGVTASSMDGGSHHSSSSAASGPNKLPSSSSSSRQMTAVSKPVAAANNTISAALFGTAFAWKGYDGWGYSDNYYYYDYYQYWREHYFMRNLYINLQIPPKVNPCKYYKDWYVDNTITFGAIVSRKGVLDYASPPQANPVGLAFPQVAVRGGTMVIVYSFAGPYGAPDGQGGILAYPGVGYSVIPGNQQSGSAQFFLAKQGAACIEQGGVKYWGAYSGVDNHFPSYKIWSAVEFAYTQTDYRSASNAATWINVFA